MAVPSASYTGLDQRASPRTDVYARLPVVLPDGRSATVTLVNISADGMLMRHDQPITDGAMLTVSMPIIGKIKATAIWSLGGRSGLNFVETIKADDYAHLLKALGARIGG
ncbi:PilZ domain-containing protein [Sphingomonas lacunae]|uniref:PilZ domain-containing protein n=1 Tax=Sphingomonas lacunae TaxID=2698828 RepID=A0A6M4B105_9SPHN|nr:PilZ domain-containing protein [Sphingomonas lacunae]QJQ33031.1 PilZ domain-containing protein [Sphingomonas lacunae]